MAKILINDGIHPAGLERLKSHGFEVETQNIPQEELAEKLPAYDAICVRSATKVRAVLIDQCPNLKVIGRGGVGLDNIDVEYARSKNIHVINTPAASSRSVAELSFGHLSGLARFLHKANIHMPKTGVDEFKALKKSYSKGFELKGKTIGIIGLGRIGVEAVKIALGYEMNVIGVDPFIDSKTIDVNYAGQSFKYDIPISSMEEMLSQADIISLHVPFTGNAVLGEAEFSQMKKGVIIINAARGGVVNEDALLFALDNDIVAAAGLDVFENEPKPRLELLQHPNVSVTPHIGASTGEAQEKIGLELADQLIELLS